MHLFRNSDLYDSNVCCTIHDLIAEILMASVVKTVNMIERFLVFKYCDSLLMFEACLNGVKKKIITTVLGGGGGEISLKVT